MLPRTILSIPILAASATLAFGQFAGFVNKGLVGVGRVPAATFDKAGDGRQDTLGGFSAMAIDTNSLVYTAGRISGRIVGLPDRGFGDGATDFRPRLEMYDFVISPYYGESPVAQQQITFTNTATVLFRYGSEGLPYTGFDAANTNAPVVPQSPAGSIGGGRRSLDAEGLVLTADGGYWVSDEYGPAIFRFNSEARLMETILPPAALLPTQGSFPGRLNFTGNSAPTSGRRNNRGLEGLSLTPDGKRLVAFLQSPTIQDGGAGGLGRNTRILQLDADSTSATYGKVVAEHVYQLTLNGNTTTNNHTPVSEVVALNASTFLVLERDGIGRGATPGLSPTYKRIVLASTAPASNIAGTAYDLERGAPGQISLPNTGTTLPDGITPIARQDFVDLLDATQLAKFGLNTSTNQDVNSLSEKWEALSLIPLKDPANPDDYLLLVGNDNDFKSDIVYHNGVPVGTNAVQVDIMLLAYRLTLPGVGATRAANVAPTIAISLPTGTSYAQGALPLTATVADTDGIVVKVEFFEDGVKLGEDTAFPWVWNFNPTVGTHTYRVVATDNSGAVSEASRSINITAGNIAPTVAITAPTANTTASAPYTIAFRVSSGDIDGSVRSVDYFAGAAKLGTSTNAPFSFSFANAPVGNHVLTAVATDNLGLTSTSAPVNLTVTRAIGGALTLQVLHASDFEAGIAALDDAPRFSSVLNALKSAYPSATLVVASGDNYIPGPFFTASADPAAPFNGIKGRADVTILNALGIQASCFGNHEFDDNTAQVRSLILPDTAAGYAGTAFPYLSANLNFAADSSMASLVTADAQEASAMKNKVAKSAIITIGGQKIGLVGGTVPELRSISSPGNIGVSQNLLTDIQASVDGLIALGVNKVIVMTHLQQFSREFELASKLRDVDIIVAGGSHSVFAKPSDRLRPEDFVASAYPTRFTSATGEPVYVVNTGSNYRYVGRLIASFDEAGRLTGFDDRSGAYATDIQGVLDTGNVPPSSNIVDVVTRLANIVDGKDGNRFGRTSVYLNGIRTSVRTEETNLGDLTADANLWRARQTDPNTAVSLKNGGGIRDSIGAVSSSGGFVSLTPPPANPRVGKQAGDVSQLDIENSLRFNNTLSLVTLTAQQLRDTMEWAVAGSGTPGQFPQVSGISFSFIPTNAPMTYVRDTNGVPTSISFRGERLRNLVVIRADDSQDVVVENGQIVGDTNRTFRIVTLNFMTAGGDSYFPLSQGTNRIDLVPTGTTVGFNTDGSEQKALADYLRAIEVFREADTVAADDLRIQNLSRRGDMVLAPMVRRIEGPSPATRLTFRSLPGRIYAAESKESLDGTWVRLPVTTQGTGTLRELLDNRTPNDQRYYRIVVVQ
jgi:5'-nucleotidase / UDP-sugar diphosphatase